METYHVGLAGLGLFTLVGLFALVSWRRRISAQENLLTKPRALEGSSSGNRCFYVATTFAGRPLDRVIAHGLAHRGHAALAVNESGIQVDRVGESCFMIPLCDLIAVSTAAAVIDRAVEKQGLVVIKWRLGSVELETHFRFVDAKMRAQTLASLSQLEGA